MRLLLAQLSQIAESALCCVAGLRFLCCRDNNDDLGATERSLWRLHPISWAVQDAQPCCASPHRVCLVCVLVAGRSCPISVCSGLRCALVSACVCVVRRTCGLCWVRWKRAFDALPTVCRKLRHVLADVGHVTAKSGIIMVPPGVAISPSVTFRYLLDNTISANQALNHCT